MTMPDAMNIATQLLAFWGAILSTILAVIQIMKFRYEGVRIRIKILSNFKAHPPVEPYGDNPLVIIKVSNVGKGATTLTHAWLMAPIKTLISADCFLKGQQKLQEGDFTQYIFRTSDVQQYGINPRDYVAVVSDAAGREFYSHIFLMRWFKILRMRLLAKKVLI